MTMQLGTVETVVGPEPVVHRLALAVRPLDAVTERPVGRGVVVARETARSVARRRPSSGPWRLRQGDGEGVPLVDHGGGVFVLLQRQDVPTAAGAAVTVRVVDPAARWVPRRLRVPIWTLGEVRGADDEPPSAAYVPALHRLLRPWLLPGSGYYLPNGSTALRIRVVLNKLPVRWPRVEAFDASGVTVGWAHGDEHGQVLLAVGETGTAPPAPPKVTLALRSHIPDPALAPKPDANDPLADLVVEDVPRSPAPPAHPTLDDDVSRGLTIPPSYLTAGQDTVLTLTVGEVLPADDIAFAT